MDSTQTSQPRSKTTVIEPSAEELAKLRPELHGIAKRYGLDMLNFATRIAGANSALDWLQTYKTLRAADQADAENQLAAALQVQVVAHAP